MRRVPFFVFVGLCAALLGSCGSGSSQDQSAQTSAPAGPSVAAVDIIDFGFQPDDVSVEVGQPVKWTNTGSASHTVTPDGGEFEGSDQLGAGDTFEFTPTEAGTFAYHCEIHPAKMKATITVAAAGGTDDAAPPEITADTVASVGATKPAKIVDFAFDPNANTIEPGDTIIWTNTGQKAHTVTADAGATFDSGSLAPGASFAWQADKAGQVQFHCDIHPDKMQGAIAIDAPGATTTVPPPPPPPADPTVELNDVQSEGDNFVVTYQVNVPLKLPGGDHLHFFFNNIKAAEAGAPGDGSYFMTAEPAVYNKIPVNAVPNKKNGKPADQLCVVVARKDHTIYKGSGGCAKLPAP